MKKTHLCVVGDGDIYNIACCLAEENKEFFSSVLRPSYKVHPRNFPDYLNKEMLSVFISNNPLFVDCFPPENVFVVSKSGKYKRVVDHPQWREWCGTMKSGEFWTWAGEDWVDKE